MAKPLSIALPPDHILSGDYKVRVTALNPTTGAVVPGVNVQNVTMQVESLTDVPLATDVFTVVAPVLIPTSP